MRCRFFSIASSSSGVNALFSVTFSNICLEEEAPIITLETQLSFNSQESANSASVCPREDAISRSASVLFSKEGVKSCSRRVNARFMRLSSGTPFLYLSVSSPCARGEKAVSPIPFSSAYAFKPFSLPCGRTGCSALD